MYICPQRAKLTCPFITIWERCGNRMRDLSELSSPNASFLSPSLCSSSLLGSWSARSCRAVPVHSFRTKCVCDSISTFAILARVNFDSVSLLFFWRCDRVFFWSNLLGLKWCLCGVRGNALRCEPVWLVVFGWFAVALHASTSLSPWSCCRWDNYSPAVYIGTTEQHVDLEELHFGFLNESVMHIDMQERRNWYLYTCWQPAIID